MSTLFIGAAALALLLPVAQATTQQPTGGVRVTQTTVTRVVLLDVKPGQRPAFDQDMMDNQIPIWEEFKKAGILTDYEIFANVTRDAPGDWNVGYALTYPNYAAFDTLGDRSGPITLKHYGTAEKRQAAGSRRPDMATIVSSRLMRALRYSR